MNMMMMMMMMMMKIEWNSVMWKKSFFQADGQTREVNSRFSQYSGDMLHKGFLEWRYTTRQASLDETQKKAFGSRYRPTCQQ